MDGKHPNLDGVQRIYRFDNGYGASVIRGKISDGNYSSYTSNEKEWELAVLKFTGNDIKDYELCYDTPITDDVVGHLAEDEVEKMLEDISKLEK